MRRGEPKTTHRAESTDKHRDWPGYVRSPPREVNERIVQIDGASFADAARDFGHRNVVGKWVYG